MLYPWTQSVLQPIASCLGFITHIAGRTSVGEETGGPSLSTAFRQHFEFYNQRKKEKEKGKKKS